MSEPFEIFAQVQPGLEQMLAEEATQAGFGPVAVVPGGVTFQGGWTDVWRANLELRGAGKVLARIASFMAFHPAQLDKRARKVDWLSVLKPGVPVRVEATSRKSKIYHAGAAQSRVEQALEAAGIPVAKDAAITVKCRVDDNRVDLSVDTSGEGLHKRGHKVAVGKAPMPETMAALVLRACEYDGAEPVLDPMCGSGTLVIEAAEIAAGLQPGRGREFAFQRLATYDAGAFEALRKPGKLLTDIRFFGSDRDQGAVRNATANAERAGVAGACSFACHPISDLERPEGPPGLVILNPPYGGRIGQEKMLFGLYGAMGKVLKERFQGWRVGFITTDQKLAHAAGLPLLPPGPPIAHGGLKVRLYRTDPLS